ncbi:MAG: FtsX-like permease family protein [Lentimicrobiaceae bacterium]|nr:FtsX-like permease family protein [Lentimicrobiaceae bacterium]
MLMLVPLLEMLFRRRDELNLLAAIGFSKKRIQQLLWRESTPVVCVSALLGIAVGLAYTCLVLFLLGNLWKGATHTNGFKVYLDLMTIVVGGTSGIILALTLLRIGIWRALNFITEKIHKRDRKQEAGRTPSLRVSKLIWASIRYTKKQALLSFITLASGVLIVFLVGLNRRSFADSSQIRTATGGFSLWCETTVPVYHNIQTRRTLIFVGIEFEFCFQFIKYSFYLNLKTTYFSKVG